MYAAVLSSLLMPASVLAFAIVVKYALITLKADANVFTQGYFFLMNLVSQIIAIVYFSQHQDTFEIKYWKAGFLGSAVNVFGCMFMNIAVTSGQPLGPMFALQMS